MAPSTVTAMSVAEFDDKLQADYQELQKPDCTDRGAKLQVFCERVWDRLPQEPAPSDAIVYGFAAMLESDKDLLLARLVIPDLRPGAADPAHPVQCSIVHHIQSHSQPEPLSKGRQIHDPAVRRLYEEELEVLHEQELYRASILLYGRGDMSEMQKEKVCKWLAAYPGVDAGAAKDGLLESLDGKCKSRQSKAGHGCCTLSARDHANALRVMNIYVSPSSRSSCITSDIHVC